MWIVTDVGFFSFVVDRKDPSYLWLRARVRADLELNFPGVEVTEHPGADYLFRAKVKRADVAARMSEMIMNADIQGHFKDVANRRSAKPTHGNRSTAYYAFWTAMAQLQPYAPYSKTPRPKPVVKPWSPPPSRTGQTGLPMFSGSHGRDYDWARNPWASDVGKAQADPPLGDDAVDMAHLGTDEIIQRLLGAGTEEEFEEIWEAMDEEERETYLDRVEEAQRLREEIEEEHGGLAALDAEGWYTVTPETYPAPRSSQYPADKQPGRRRQAPGIPADAVEDQNRLTYLAKKAKRRKGRKNRHNQQG